MSIQVRIPSPEDENTNIGVEEIHAAELKKGHFVGKSDIAVFSIDELDRSRNAVHTIRAGKTHSIQLNSMRFVASVQIGDLRHASMDTPSVSIIEDTKGQIFAYIDGTDAFQQLKPSSQDGSFLVGREVPGQESLPSDVSRMHCVLGLDEEGTRIIVQNLNPTHDTFIKGYGSAD